MTVLSSNYDINSKYIKTIKNLKNIKIGLEKPIKSINDNDDSYLKGFYGQFKSNFDIIDNDFNDIIQILSNYKNDEFNRISKYKFK